MVPLTRLCIVVPEAACQGGRSVCRRMIRFLERHGCEIFVTRPELGWVTQGNLHAVRPLELTRHNLIIIEALIDRAALLEAVYQQFAPGLPEAWMWTNVVEAWGWDRRDGIDRVSRAPENVGG